MKFPIFLLTAATSFALNISPPIFSHPRLKDQKSYELLDMGMNRSGEIALLFSETDPALNANVFIALKKKDSADWKIESIATFETDDEIGAEVFFDNQNRLNVLLDLYDDEAFVTRKENECWSGLSSVTPDSSCYKKFRFAKDGDVLSFENSHKISLKKGSFPEKLLTYDSSRIADLAQSDTNESFAIWTETNFNPFRKELIIGKIDENGEIFSKETLNLDSLDSFLNSYETDFSIGPQNEISIFYETRNGSVISIFKDPKDLEWSFSDPVPTKEDAWIEITSAFDGLGNLMLLWFEESDTTSISTMYKPKGKPWGKPEKISSDSQIFDLPELKGLPQGGFAAFFETNHIYAKVFHPEKEKWSSLFSLTKGMKVYGILNVLIGVNGEGLVSWSRSNLFPPASQIEVSLLSFEEDTTH